jgi:hypothetical protein
VVGVGRPETMESNGKERCEEANLSNPRDVRVVIEEGGTVRSLRAAQQVAPTDQLGLVRDAKGSQVLQKELDTGGREDVGR